MSCKHARQQIESMFQPEDASAGLMQHLLGCDSCRKLSEERRLLQCAISRLRSETINTGPSSRVEHAVIASLQAEDMRHQPAVHQRSWLFACALSSIAVLVAAFLMTTHRSHIVESAHAASEPFTAMPYVVPPAPYERTSIVRTEVPLQIMISAGFQVQGDDPGSTTLADVLYGEDGRILAIRLVSQPSEFTTTRMD